MNCTICSAAPAVANVTYYRNVGMVIMRRAHTLRGSMCKKCGIEQYLKMTGSTCLLGWWGHLSFFINIGLIIANTAAVVRFMRTPRVQSSRAEQGGSPGGATTPPTPVALMTSPAASNHQESGTSRVSDAHPEPEPPGRIPVPAPTLGSAVEARPSLDADASAVRLRYSGAVFYPVFSSMVFLGMTFLFLSANGSMGRAASFMFILVLCVLAVIAGVALSFTPRVLIISEAGVRMEFGWLGRFRELAWRDVIAVSRGSFLRDSEPVVLGFRSSAGATSRWPLKLPGSATVDELGSTLRAQAERGGHFVKSDFPTVEELASKPKRKTTSRDWLAFGLLLMLAANFIPAHGQRAIESFALRDGNALVGILCLVAIVGLLAILGLDRSDARWPAIASLCLVVFRYFWFHYDGTSLSGDGPWELPKVIEFASYAIVALGSVGAFAGSGRPHGTHHDQAER